MALLPAEQMVKMVEHLLEDEDLLEELNLPYLRRLRNQALTEGRAEGLRAYKGRFFLLTTIFAGFLPVRLLESVMPAQAGIQCSALLFLRDFLDSRFRGNDAPWNTREKTYP